MSERRWKDEGAPPEYQRLMASLSLDEASVERVRAVRERLAAAAAGPPSDSSVSTDPTNLSSTGAAGLSSVGLKTIVSVTLGAVMAASGGLWLLARKYAPSRPPPAMSTLEPALQLASSAEVETKHALPAAPVQKKESLPSTARVRSATSRALAISQSRTDEAKTETANVDEELQMLQDASSASPARALELTDDHAARFPDSQLAEERELLAVRALLKLGRRRDAEIRASSFRSRWPASPLMLRMQAAMAE